MITEHERRPAGGILGVHALSLGDEVGEDVGVAQHGRHVYGLAALLVTRVQPRATCD